MLDWLDNVPTEMEGYIRPGCILLTVFVRMPIHVWEKVSMFNCTNRLSFKSRLPSFHFHYGFAIALMELVYMQKAFTHVISLTFLPLHLWMYVVCIDYHFLDLITVYSYVEILRRAWTSY